MMSAKISDHESVEEKSHEKPPDKSPHKSSEKSHGILPENMPVKVETPKEEEIDVERVRTTMCRLKEASEYATQSCKDDLRIINQAMMKEGMAETLRELGLARLAATIFKQCFHADWTAPEGSFHFINMYMAAGSLWNGTDKSAAICEDVVDQGLAKDVVNYLDHPKANPERLTDNGIKFCVRPILSILHNVVQKCDTARTVLREASAVDVLPKFRSVADAETKCVVNLVLAYIVTEEENDKINEVDDNIAFVINMLRQVYNLKTGQPKPHGFHTDELLEGLNKLANNDSNKVRIVRMNALPLYTELLAIGNPKEQSRAAKGLWRLAFRCKDFIIQEPGCIDALQKLASSEDKEVRKGAKGALWELKEHTPKTVAKTPKAKDNTVCITDGKHIMISYQWGSQILMKRIRDRLKEAGYKVWMDVDNMAKSPLEAMAAAVEDACVVLIAASRKYKDSESCRTEGVYAYNLRRDIVPLIVETGYRPDGWLGPLVLNNLYVNFAKENAPFENKMAELMKELGHRGKPSSDGEANDALVQKVVDTSTVHAATRQTHSGDDRGHGEDVIDGPRMSVVVKQPPTLTVLKPASAYTGWAHCLCCLRPCHRHVKVHPEEQQYGTPTAVHISWCCSTVDVEFRNQVE